MNEFEIKNLAMNSISSKKNSALHLAKENYDKATKIEGFSQLYSEYRDQIFSFAMEKSLKNDTAKIKAKMQKLEGELQSLLSSHSLSLPALSPKFACEKCRDEGYHDGEMCDCLKAEITKIRDKALFSLSSSEIGLEDIKDDIFSEKDRQRYQKLLGFLKNRRESFPDIKERFFVFSGTPGTGKTFLARAFIRDLRLKGFDSLSISSFSLSESFMRYHINFADNVIGNLQSLMNIPLLLIDDIGQEPMRSNVTNEYLLALLNERNKRGKITIFTTNYSSEHLINLYSNAVVSRIFDVNSSISFNFDFEDFRLKK